MKNKFNYALNASDGEIVHASNVENGDACNCICPNPSCGAPVRAYNKGKKQSPHFRHKGDTDCGGALESLIHKMAKEILLKEKLIYLEDPTYDFDPYQSDPFYYNNFVLFGNHPFKITNPVQEKILLIENNEKIICDVYAEVEIMGKYFPINIEVFVTHKLDSEKCEKLKNLDLLTVELNLSKFSKKEDWTKEELSAEVQKFNNYSMRYVPDSLIDYLSDIRRKKSIKMEREDEKLNNLIKKVQELKKLPKLFLKEIGKDMFNDFKCIEHLATNKFRIMFYNNYPIYLYYVHSSHLNEGRFRYLPIPYSIYETEDRVFLFAKEENGLSWKRKDCKPSEKDTPKDIIMSNLKNELIGQTIRVPNCQNIEHIDKDSGQKHIQPSDNKNRDKVDFFINEIIPHQKIPSIFQIKNEKNQKLNVMIQEDTYGTEYIINYFGDKTSTIIYLYDKLSDVNIGIFDSDSYKWVFHKGHEKAKWLLYDSLESKPPKEDWDYLHNL